MSQDTENLEQLRRLLRLKRYEQPPPGYFDDFPGQVVARLKQGERGEHDALLMERLLWQASWLQPIREAFEPRAVVSGVFGLATCALLLTGVVYSARSTVHPMALIPDRESSGFSSEKIAAVMAANHPLRAKRVSLEPSSTDPVPAVPLNDHW